MIREWFLSKNQHERRLLILAAAIAIALLFYTLVAAPFLDTLHQHRQKASKQDDLISWMQETSATIRQLGSNRKSAATSVPLLTLIDRSARQHRLGSYLHRLEPQGTGVAQIWFKEIPFDNLARWLQSIHQQYDITVVNLGIQRQAKTGIVDARIVLSGGAR